MLAQQRGESAAVACHAWEHADAALATGRPIQLQSCDIRELHCRGLLTRLPFLAISDFVVKQLLSLRRSHRPSSLLLRVARRRVSCFAFARRELLPPDCQAPFLLFIDRSSPRPVSRAMAFQPDVLYPKVCLVLRSWRRLSPNASLSSL